MIDDPERAKLEDLAARIRRAGNKPAPETGVPPDTAKETAKASRIGFDFVVAVGSCALLGVLADRFFGTRPWGLLIMILAGFAVGIFNVWRALAGYDQAVGWHKPDGKE